jgi:uncharacterized oxidoreductase
VKLITSIVDSTHPHGMIYRNQTLLITGGASGIGLALAKRFVAADNTVIVCGRRSEKLAEAKRLIPELHTVRCDVSIEAERLALHQEVLSQFPKLTVLINNAGIQNRPPSLTAPQDWSAHHREIATNLEAPLHLAMLFIPHLMEQPAAAIMNVSSGLAFSPLAFMGTYCATKAAVHSFTLSLRHQLRNTRISVVEIIPPKVNTDLGGVGLHDDGAPLDAFADSAFESINTGHLEFGYGFSEKNRMASRTELDQTFALLNPHEG